MLELEELLQGLFIDWLHRIFLLVEKNSKCRRFFQQGLVIQKSHFWGNYLCYWEWSPCFPWRCWVSRCQSSRQHRRWHLLRKKTSTNHLGFFPGLNSHKPIWTCWSLALRLCGARNCLLGKFRSWGKKPWIESLKWREIVFYIVFQTVKKSSLPRIIQTNEETRKCDSWHCI